jgi:ribonuclease HI
MLVQIYIDGASRGNPGPASVGVVLLDASGKTLKEHYRTIGETTNNVAEYTALVDALGLAKEIGATSVKVHSDSQLLVRQVTGIYKIKNAKLLEFVKEIHALKAELAAFEIVHVRREFNKHADRLANVALDAVKKKALTSADLIDPAEVLRSARASELLS